MLRVLVRNSVVGSLKRSNKLPLVNIVVRRNSNLFSVGKETKETKEEIEKKKEIERKEAEDNKWALGITCIAGAAIFAWFLYFYEPEQISDSVALIAECIDKGKQPSSSEYCAAVWDYQCDHQDLQTTIELIKDWRYTYYLHIPIGELREYVKTLSLLDQELFLNVENEMKKRNLNWDYSILLSVCVLCKWQEVRDHEELQQKLEQEKLEKEKQDANANTNANNDTNKNNDNNKKSKWWFFQKKETEEKKPTSRPASSFVASTFDMFLVEH